MMTLKLGVALLVTVVLFTASAQSERFECSNDCDQYRECSYVPGTAEFAVLAIENVKVNCHSKSCMHKASSDWSLHGLWPSMNRREAPLYCNLSSSFDEDLLGELKTKMERVWPSLEDHTKNSTFWTHEWCKHGTCAKKQFPLITDQHTFFKKALELFDQVNVGETLKKAGISDKTTVADIMHVFEGRKPILDCTPARHTGEQVLSAIKFCYSTENLKPIPCKPEWFTEDVCYNGTVLVY